jgi:autotransporter-associated beta strand protein
MKAKHLHVITFGALGLVMPATADVIYSNLQDIAIPATFDGLYLNVETGAWNTNMAAPVAGWDINPLYGGRSVANSPAFQPVRSGTGSASPIVNLAAGASVGTGSVFSTFVQGAGGETPGSPGYGGSQMLTGSGGNFTADQEGYLGFRLNGTNYGSMRVVFTNNTSGAMIKDWAYDNTGAAIGTGWIHTDIVSGTARTVTLNPGSSEAFTLGSQLANASGSITNSVLKTGAGTTILTGANTYSGTTTVNEGALLVNGSITGLGTVSVAGGATLGGSGSIAGPVIVDGILSPGTASIESLSTGALTLNTGSAFAYEMNSSVVGNDKGDLQIVNGNLTLNGHIELALSESTFTPNTTTLTIIQYTGALLGAGGFFFGETPLSEGTVFNDGHNNWKISYVAPTGGSNFATSIPGSHFITLSNLTAIPEPGSSLALGCLIGSGALLRRRRGKNVEI